MHCFNSKFSYHSENDGSLWYIHVSLKCMKITHVCEWIFMRGWLWERDHKNSIVYFSSLRSNPNIPGPRTAERSKTTGHRTCVARWWPIWPTAVAIRRSESKDISNGLSQKQKQNHMNSNKRAKSNLLDQLFMPLLDLFEDQSLLPELDLLDQLLVAGELGLEDQSPPLELGNLLGLDQLLPPENPPELKRPPGALGEKLLPYPPPPNVSSTILGSCLNYKLYEKNII